MSHFFFYLPNISKPKRLHHRIILIRRPNYRKGFTDALIPCLTAAGYEIVEYFLPRPQDVKPFPELYGIPQEIAKMGDPPPDAVIRWEEHGCLFSTRPWVDVVNWLYDHGIPPLSVDLGYFEHYGTLMIDRYLRDGTSSINDDWPKLSGDDIENDEWFRIADLTIRDYYDRQWRTLDQIKNDPPIQEPGYVAVWAQFATSLTRPQFRFRTVGPWLEKTVQVLREAGHRPLIKLNPVVQKDNIPAIEKLSADGIPVYRHNDKKNPEHLNTRILRDARYNVLISTSVSNEMTVLRQRVHALGRSWFLGHDVFHEPDDWDGITHDPPINMAARNKWTRWWCSHQFPIHRAGFAMDARIKEFHRSNKPRRGRPPAHGIDYAHIYTHVYAHNAAYDNPRKRSHAALAALELCNVHNRKVKEPKITTVIDVGCGTGYLVEQLRAKQILAHGVEPASVKFRGQARWYHQGDVRRLRWPDKKFDAVVCLDVLEHIHPDHVDQALTELIRVSRQWLILSIATGPGRRDWKLPPSVKNLHLTVRPLDEWMRDLRSKGCKLFHQTHGGSLDNITIYRVPGAF